MRVDLVAAGKRRAPTVVVEGAREVVHIRCAIALGAVVRVVEVGLEQGEGRVRDDSLSLLDSRFALWPFLSPSDLAL